MHCCQWFLLPKWLPDCWSLLLQMIGTCCSSMTRTWGSSPQLSGFVPSMPSQILRVVVCQKGLKELVINTFISPRNVRNWWWRTGMRSNPPSSAQTSHREPMGWLRNTSGLVTSAIVSYLTVSKNKRKFLEIHGQIQLMFKGLRWILDFVWWKRMDLYGFERNINKN